METDPKLEQANADFKAFVEKYPDLELKIVTKTTQEIVFMKKVAPMPITES